MKNKEKGKFITKGDLTYVTFAPWEDSDMIHGFTTRYGGVSKEHLTSLNLGFNRGDDEDNVFENYSRVCAALGVDRDSLVLSKQVHETNITKVTKEHRGNGINFSNIFESVDGIYTTEKDITLVTHYADCVPLFFYAPKHEIIGMAHAGWRGTVGEIGRKMIECWVEEEGITPEDIQVVIGPSIGPCCFEVGDEVVSEFITKFNEPSYITFNEETNKHHINLWECNAKILKDAKVPEENIIQTNLCTCCNSNIFFSHRKSKGQRGTMAGFMCLK